MATILTATWRATVPYTISGLAHKLHIYAKIATTTPTFSVRHRNGIDSSDFDDIMDRLASRLTNVLPSGTVIGTCLFEQRSGSIWTPQYSYLPTDTFSGSLQPATQLTAVLRDTAFKKVRLTVLDTKIAAPAHYPGLSGGGLDGFIAGWGEAGAVVPEDPWFWAVSRGSNYMLSSPFAGTTMDLNDKIRRARGLV